MKFVPWNVPDVILLAEIVPVVILLPLIVVEPPLIALTTTSPVKAIILGTKALISALIAGGWIALLIIVLICLVGFLCSSIFGIFFSDEINLTILL